jgi:adenine-specific DNA methylase
MRKLKISLSPKSKHIEGEREVKMEKVPTDFELLILLMRELKKFSYKELQEVVGTIQANHKLFQTYFDNHGDIEGVDPPESLQLGFHFKVLYQLGYIQRVGTEYIPSEKCKEIDRHKDEYHNSLKIIKEVLSSFPTR